MNKYYSPNYILQKMNQEQLDTNLEQIIEVFTENQVSTQDQIELLIKKKSYGTTDFSYEYQNKILRYLLSKGHDFDESKKYLKLFIVHADTLNQVTPQ